MGSLFDGIGGFPLAAALVRISVWLEREPVCPAPAPAFLWNKFEL